MSAASSILNLHTFDRAPEFTKSLQQNIDESNRLKSCQIVGKFLVSDGDFTADASISFRWQDYPSDEEIFQEATKEITESLEIMPPHLRLFAELPIEDPKIKKWLHDTRQSFLEDKRDPLKRELEPRIIELLSNVLEPHRRFGPIAYKITSLSVKVIFFKTAQPEQDLSICFEGNPSPEEGPLVDLFKLSPPSRFKRLVVNPLKKMANVVSALFKRLAAILTWPLRYTQQKPTEDRGISSNLLVAPGYSYRQGHASAVPS